MLIWAGTASLRLHRPNLLIEWRFAFTAILLDDALLVVIVAVFGMTLWATLWPLLG